MRQQKEIERGEFLTNEEFEKEMAEWLSPDLSKEGDEEWTW
ncbi:MAG: hypothetical protein ABI723_15930 [Bacteroidia bacterium]